MKGKTQLELAAEPPIFEVPRAKPHQSTQVESKIVSQAWSAFTIDDIQSSLPGVSWKLEQLDTHVLKQMEVKSGWRMIVTLPAGMPEGNFNEHIRIVARPVVDRSILDTQDPAIADPVEREIPLVGKVLRQLVVYGDDINVVGTIEAGTLPPRAAYVGQFTLRVNDDLPDLAVTDVVTAPEFIQASLEPYSESGTPGLYRLRVRIPADTPPAAYVGENLGKLTLTFDHPRIKSLELGVEFIVLDSVRKSNGTPVAAAHGP
ncbi:MAG: hypothetical protein WD669_11070 [Pirellulales bacterium]